VNKNRKMGHLTPKNEPLDQYTRSLTCCIVEGAVTNGESAWSICAPPEEGPTTVVRTRSSFIIFAVLATMALLCVMATSSEAAAGTTTRVSVDSFGAEANGESSSISISAQGRYVAFHSFASNLVAGDTNNALDVFVHDRTTGTTELVSVDSAGNQDANAYGQQPSISADGRYVTFLASGDSNLVPNDTNEAWDIFVHDRTTGTTELVSVNSSGELANGNSFSASVSADGHYVVFGSAATNLVPGDTNDTWDIFVHDLQTGTTERVNVNDSGNQANSVSHSASLSSEGRYVAFSSSATNLVEGDTNGEGDIFVRDLQTGTTELVSVNSSGVQAFYGGYDPSISSDGRYVVFTSRSKNLLAPGFWSASDEVFVHDRTARTTEWVSKDSGQGQSNGDSWHADISSDGRYVTFHSDATDLVAGSDTSDSIDVFVRDLQARTTQRVTVSRCATQPNGEHFGASISSDGRYVAFDSLASNLVAGDTNDTWDSFVHDRQTVPTQPSDCIAPSTTASASTATGAAYTSGTWTNEDVKVSLDALDNEGGTEVKKITYRINDGDNQTYNPTDKIPISSEGTTTIRYFATDNAGNTETAKTFTVKLDKTAPEVTPGDNVSNVWRSKPLSEQFTASDSGSGLANSADAAFTLTASEESASATQPTVVSRTVFDVAGNLTIRKVSALIDLSAPRLDIDNSDGSDGITPSNKETGVSRDSEPTATFSDEMNVASLGTAAKLYQWNARKKVWRRVPVEVGVVGKMATLNPFPAEPRRLLAANKKYKVTITTGATNLAGLSMSSAKSWTFITGSSLEAAS
jgi:hypothetical protein